MTHSVFMGSPCREAFHGHGKISMIHGCSSMKSRDIMDDHEGKPMKRLTFIFSKVMKITMDDKP